MPNGFDAVHAFSADGALRKWAVAWRRVACTAATAAVLLGIATFDLGRRGLANDDSAQQPSSSASAATVKVVLYAEQWNTAEKIKSRGGIVLPDDGRLDVPVEYIDVAHRPIAATNLQLLDKFQNLKTLSLAYTGVSDDSLRRFLHSRN